MTVGGWAGRCSCREATQAPGTRAESRTFGDVVSRSAVLTCEEGRGIFDALAGDASDASHGVDTVEGTGMADLVRDEDSPTSANDLAHESLSSCSISSSKRTSGEISALMGLPLDVAHESRRSTLRKIQPGRPFPDVPDLST